jgi:RNA polymerase sigma-70 factor (ECF subfamily)
LRDIELGFDFADNEVALVDRLQVGSEEAFETLIELYQAPVYNLAYRILSDHAEACDAVQETFLKIYKGISHFRGESGLKTWIYKIALSECLNRQRWWKRWRHYVTASLDEPACFGQDPGAKKIEVADTGPNPEVSCAAHETEQVIQKALRALPLDFRMVVVLRDVEGLSYEEIAEALGLSLGTVKSRLWRGRLELKAQLRETLRRPRSQDQG